MTAWVEEIVKNMGYTGLALLTFIENILPPIPSEVILPLGGFLSAQGHLTLGGVIVAGVLGSMVGAVVLYYMGRLVTQERLEDWVEDHGGWLLLTRGDINSAFQWFERHGSKAVLIARVIPGVRSLISIPAGVSEMPLGRFLLYTALGTAVWSAALAYGGMLLGREYQSLSYFLKWAAYAVVGLLVLSVVWWYVQRRRERIARRQAQQPGS